MSADVMVGALLGDDPREVGGFRLRGVLGEGGMGRVFLGFSPSGHAVAVKVVHPEVARDPEFRRRFRREVAAVRGVASLYTAPVVAAGPNDPVPWLATAFVVGPSLERAVREQGPLPADVVWKLGGSLAEALARIHADGVIHRDLKPGNIMLAAAGPKVIDFGISRVLDETTMTETGMILGTPSFMSPEQAVGEHVGTPSDVFSLGGVLAYATTGRRPFGEGNVAAIIFRIVSADPDLAGIPAPLSEVISQCMAKDPADRPDLCTLIGMIAARAADTPELLTAGAFWPAGVRGLISSCQSELNAATQALGQGLSTQTRNPMSSSDGMTPLEAESQPVTTGPPSPPRPAMRLGLRHWRARRGMLVATAMLVLAAAAVAINAALPQKPAPTISNRAGQPVPAPLGPPDLTGYCRAMGEGTATLKGSDASGWRCTGGTAPLVEGINAVCAWSYGVNISQVTTTIRNYYSANTWNCWQVHRQLRPPDWNGYCEAHGLGADYLALDNAYGWFCSGYGSGLDIDTVCEWTNNKSSLVVGRFSNFSDPRSWQCWVLQAAMRVIHAAGELPGYRAAVNGTATCISACPWNRPVMHHRPDGRDGRLYGGWRLMPRHGTDSRHGLRRTTDRGSDPRNK